MSSRLSFGLLFLLLLPLQVRAAIFADDDTASPYDHDRLGRLAGTTVLEICGVRTHEESQALLAQLPGWNTPADEQRPGVLIREYQEFAGERGLDARFRIDRNSCVLTLSPYDANARAGDELAYGVSEAAAKAFGDEETGWQPEQAMSGLQRIDPAGRQHQQTFYLQWQQQGGVPQYTWFALFDHNPQEPRVLVGRRTFNGQVVFGMADSQWRPRRTASGNPFVAIRGKDPVDPERGGFNLVSITRTANDRFSLKAWLPIGTARDPFRLKPSLGDAPLTGFRQTTIATSTDDRLVIETLPVQIPAAIPGKRIMLGKGLYPVYLDLDASAMTRLAGAEMFTLVLEREGGSEIHLQIPAGAAFGSLVREHLGAGQQPDRGEISATD